MIKKLSAFSNTNCNAHAIINPVEVSAAHYISFDSNNPTLHDYLRYDDYNRFPLELLQQLITWAIFISIVCWPLLISPLTVLNIILFNIFIIIIPSICIVIYMKQPMIKILHCISWNILSFVLSRVIVSCLFTTYIMQIDQDEYSKIDTLSSFIEKGTDETDKKERFISVHYYLLQRYFECFENKQIIWEHIITEDLTKFRNTIIRNYNEMNGNININTHQFCEWQFLSPKQLSLTCINSASWLFYEIVSPNVCCKLFHMKWFSTIETMIYVYSSVLLNVCINYYISINILWSSDNIEEKHKIYLYVVIMAVFDLIIILYISKYAMTKNKRIYNFEDMYDKYHLHKLLAWHGIHNIAQEIKTVYFYGRTKREIMQQILTMLCGHIGIAQIILNYTMGCGPYIINKRDHCICYHQLCSYDEHFRGRGTQWMINKNLKSRQRNRRWFTMIIDIILMMIFGYYTIWEWIILRILLVFSMLFGLFVTCIKICEGFR